MVFIPTAYIFAASSHPNAPALIPHFILSVLALAGIVWLLRNHRLPLSNLLSVALVGIFLSVPFVPPWDSDQMRAYAAVLPFIAFLPALGAMSLWSVPLIDQNTSCLNEERNLKWWSYMSLVFIGVASIGLPIWAYGRYPVGNFDNLSSKCNKGSLVINAEILPGTMRDVLGNENLPSIKTVGKRFLVDPVGSLYKIPQLLITGSLTKDVLEKNLFTEFAPDYVRSFIHAVHAGDSFAYARVNESSGEISSLKLVFFSREAAKFAFKSNVFCATELVKLNALRLDINTAP